MRMPTVGSPIFPVHPHVDRDRQIALVAPFGGGPGRLVFRAGHDGLQSRLRRINSHHVNTRISGQIPMLGRFDKCVLDARLQVPPSLKCLGVNCSRGSERP